jgi:hypothetical protein
MLYPLSYGGDYKNAKKLYPKDFKKKLNIIPWPSPDLWTREL